MELFSLLGIIIQNNKNNVLARILEHRAWGYKPQKETEEEQ
jgi:hypothetical protein